LDDSNTEDPLSKPETSNETRNSFSNKNITCVEKEPVTGSVVLIGDREGDFDDFLDNSCNSEQKEPTLSEVETPTELQIFMVNQLNVVGEVTHTKDAFVEKMKDLLENDDAEEISLSALENLKLCFEKNGIRVEIED